MRLCEKHNGFSVIVWNGNNDKKKGKKEKGVESHRFDGQRSIRKQREWKEKEFIFQNKKNDFQSKLVKGNGEVIHQFYQTRSPLMSNSDSFWFPSLTSNSQTSLLIHPFFPQLYSNNVQMFLQQTPSCSPLLPQSRNRWMWKRLKLTKSRFSQCVCHWDRKKAFVRVRINKKLHCTAYMCVFVRICVWDWEREREIMHVCLWERLCTYVWG